MKIILLLLGALLLYLAFKLVRKGAKLLFILSGIAGVLFILMVLGIIPSFFDKDGWWS